MCLEVRLFGRVAAIGAALALVVPLVAQQPALQPPASPQQQADDGPTKKDPLRFTAFNVSMQAGLAGVTNIVIERWTTDEERKGLLDVLAGASFKVGGQAKLLTALQKIKPRTGFIRTANSIGRDLKYARENMLSDGTRQIVIATDKPVSMGAAMRGSDVLNHPFTFIEMRMKPNDKGEGRMLVATAVEVRDGRLQLENYAQEPVRLTSITEQEKKKK